MSDSDTLRRDNNREQVSNAVASVGQNVWSAELALAVQKIVDEKPEIGRRLLAALKASEPQEAGSRLADILSSVAKLSETDSEAVYPTPLTLVTTSLDETWAKVGRYVRSGIGDVEKTRHRSHE